MLTQGKSYENASSVPSVHRQRAFSSVMRELANVHRYHWVTGYDERYKEHTSSASFWQSQVGENVLYAHAHARTHARTHTRTHTRTHACTHTHTANTHTNNQYIITQYNIMYIYVCIGLCLYDLTLYCTCIENGNEEIVEHSVQLDVCVGMHGYGRI